MARRIPRYILTYGLWAVSAALALWALYWLRVTLIDLAIIRLRWSPWTLRAVDRFGTVILGLLWLIVVVATEAYFRRMLNRRLWATHVVMVFAAEALVLGLAYGGHLLIT